MFHSQPRGRFRQESFKVGVPSLYQRIRCELGSRCQQVPCASFMCSPHFLNVGTGMVQKKVCLSTGWVLNYKGGKEGGILKGTV